MESFGDRLKKLRGSINGTAFAEKLGINRQTLYRYERGERDPDIGFIRRVSELTGASVDWLVFGKGEAPACLRIPSAADRAPAEPCADGSTDVEAQLVRLKRAVGVSTDTALAKWLGITQGGISSAKKRGRLPNRWFVKISKECGVPLDWLISGREGAPASAQQIPTQPMSRGKQVTVMAFAACSISGWSNSGPLAVRVQMPVDYPEDSDIIAVIAIGASMQPDGIRQGNLVFCDPAVKPNPGDSVYVEQNDGKASLKQFLNQDEEWIYLQGWGMPDEQGRQKPYTEKISNAVVRRVACVVVVQRKA